MHRLILTLTLGFSTCSAALSVETHTPSVIPAGTQITMYVPGQSVAQTAHPGDHFLARASVDVTVGGVVVVLKGAEGSGTIRAMKRAADARSSVLTLVFDWVYAVDGTKVPLLQSDAAHPSREDQDSTAAGSPYLPAFGLAGFFGFVNTFAKDNVSVSVRSSAP